jgi:calcineurin-like phosphoesterase family protein
VELAGRIAGPDNVPWASPTVSSRSTFITSSSLKDYEKESNVRFFTSDLHFGHKNIIDFCDRPYSSVGAMNEWLILNHNSMVSQDDEVWFVGDLAMGTVEDSLKFATRLNGRKKLIPGNHDKCHPMHPNYRDKIAMYEDAGFEILEPQVTTVIDGIEVLVCHFPYFGDSKPGKDRYSGLRPDDQGGWLICGHVHDAWTVKNRMINVGVDVWNLHPVPEQWLADIIRTP